MRKWFLLSLAMLLVLSMIGCRASQLESTPGAGNNPDTTVPATTTGTAATAPTVVTIPTTVATMPTTVPTIPTTVPPETVPIGPTAPPVEGDVNWGVYKGKSFVKPTELNIGFKLTLYSDGSFSYFGSPLNSFFNFGVWRLEGDLLYLIEIVQNQPDEDPVETGDVSCFRYVPGENGEGGKLIFIKGTNDLLGLEREEDGAEYLYAGIKPWA